jgi:FHA domain
VITCTKCKGQSTSLDYCDQCGAPLSTGASAAAAPVAATPTAACPNCQAHRDTADVFCEICGYDFATGTLPSLPTPITPAASLAPTAWELVVSVDPARWEQQAALRSTGAAPPATTTVQLVTGSVSVGRTSRSRNVHPDLDLAALTVDPAVSHRHAVLTLRADGRWEVIDLDSENGTTHNGADVSSQPAVLASGDRLDLGAWTTITIRKHPS